jgi:2-oxoglutarate ferredoxin oxidoreductase subunit delta
LPKIIYDQNLCKACGLCVEFCPVKAITFTANLNEKGYRVLSFDQEVCTACGTCYRMCPDLAITVQREGK